MGHKERTLRVLVADDNDDILALFCELLKLNSFDVVGTAKSGREAVDLYALQNPDVTFLDVVMSDGDGIYALTKIRETSPDAIVIMVTSDLTPTTAQRLERCRASAVVYKPFDMTDIIKAVRKASSVKMSQVKSPIR
ncbi:MAG TPA: response regulator [Candidatus Nitrosotalea sp.]|nr:response regulator [Candidatus Nitrosotalea sp.]